MNDTDQLRIDRVQAIDAEVAAEDFGFAPARSAASGDTVMSTMSTAAVQSAGETAEIARAAEAHPLPDTEAQGVSQQQTLEPTSGGALTAQTASAVVAPDEDRSIPLPSRRMDPPSALGAGHRVRNEMRAAAKAAAARQGKAQRKQTPAAKRQESAPASGYPSWAERALGG